MVTAVASQIEAPPPGPSTKCVCVCQERTPVVKIVEKLLRAGEGRMVKRLENIASQVNAIEEDFQKLTDAAIKDVDEVVKTKETELMAV